MAGGEEIRIRSYRVCFELERRIHHVDRWRIPVPYGVPLRGIAYGAIALIGVLVIQRLPLIGALATVLHPALRLVVLPIGVAWALVRLRVDGRPLHAAALAWLRWRAGPARVAGFRAAERPGPAFLPDLAVAGDESGFRYRPARVAGPATVTLRYPARGSASRRRLTLRQTGDSPLWRGKRITVGRGQEVRFG